MTQSTEFFVREGNDQRYKVRLVNDTDLPRRIFLNFADVDHDQQVNSAMAQRSADAVDSARELTLDLSTLVLDKDTAQQLVERLIRSRWFSREIIDMKLTAQQLALEPADTDSIELDGTTMTARLVKMDIGAGGVISTQWERYDASMSVLSGSEGADMLGRFPSAILVPVLSKGFVLDVPLFYDADDQTTPFLYVGAGPYDDGFWPGTDFYFSDTGDVLDYAAGWDGIPSTDASTWGYISGALNDAVHDVIDEGAGVTVVLYNGTLTSITETQMLEDETLNLAIIGSETNGWELIQFQTATLTAANTYTLTNLIRGARGTEQYIDTHVNGDSFLLVSSFIKKHVTGASEIGDTDYYKPVTQGRDENVGVVFSITFSAAANKPYSGAHVAGTQSATTGDWTVTWVRRTRIGASTLDGQDVPLGETSESYEVDILDGSTVVRTITATDETITYTAAQQVTDFGFEQAEITINIYQMSPSLSLRGFAASATLSSANIIALGTEDGNYLGTEAGAVLVGG